MAALLLSSTVVFGVPHGPRSSLPALVPGEALFYLLEYRSSIQSQSAGPIYTPAAAHRLDISVGSRIRLDVLDVKDDPRQGRLTRLRVTYKTCDASVRSDGYDPGATAIEKQYRGLQGRSFEFTVDEQGRVREVTGLDRLEPDENARNAIRQWISAIALPMGLWKPGLKPGKKWSREIPLADAPLAGLAWRTQSTYRDDEPCPAPIGARAGWQGQTCAVIATRLETVRNGSRGDQTPPAYLRNGLKTGGRWMAEGQSLSYVSLSTGLVDSSTARESDEIDLMVTATLSGSRLHYAGQTESSSQIALMAVQLPQGARQNVK